MKTLEDELKQEKFLNEYHKLGINLYHTAAWWKLIQGEFFKKVNLTTQQYNILRILRGTKDKKVTLGYISERMIDKNSNTSRVVDKLYKKSLVSRTYDAQDRRKIDLQITDKGLTLLAELDKEMPDLEANLTAISEDEAKTLNGLLEKLKYSK